jgi:LmbE family N-acetylglucosaminyl deacetylase
MPFKSCRSIVGALLLAAAPLLAPTPSAAQLEPLAFDRGASGLALALRRVGVAGRVLYVTAHPDDENNAVLVRLSRGLGLHTALLTVTRGEGGQNAIGPELFEALGVLRTGELMAMHRYDAVEQFFGRAYEFGYSFSVEETYEKWGREATLGDVVRVVRAFRPDVILTLPLEARGGGMHHQAVARLARDAFRAAADPRRFPEQGLRPWQARKIYQGGTGGYPMKLPGTPVRVPTGAYDPVFGWTWRQVGSRERSLHRCQGVSQILADPGPAEAVYYLVDSEPHVPGPETDILDGIDTTLRGIAALAPGSSSLVAPLAELESRAEAARASFDARAREASLPALGRELQALRALRAELPGMVDDASRRADVKDRLGEEEQDLEKALVLAQGVVLEARADDGLVTPGQSFGVTVSVWNEGHAPMSLDALSLEAPPGWTVAGAGEPAEPPAPGAEPAGAAVRRRFAVTVAPDARPSQPYWRRRPGQDRYDLTVPADETLPWSPPVLSAHLRAHIGGEETTFAFPAIFRYPGPFVGGEKQHVVQVVPGLSIRVAPEVTAVPLAGGRSSIDVTAFARQYEPGPGRAVVRLETPAGWQVEPTSAPVRFAYEGEEVAARFRVVPPPHLEAGTLRLRAVAARDGREYDETVQEVAYDHIQRRQLLRPAETTVLALDVRTTPGIAVGYVMGSGDAVADAIQQLGVPITLLTSDDLAFGDLSRFSTIATGIRAYETRRDLRSSNPRLLRWVEGGGHLVVQYNRAAFNRVEPGDRPGGGGEPSPEAETSPFTPYPAIVTSNRISDETTPIRVLAPEHPLLTTPNRIGEADWAGWVQERAIQLLEPRDPRYEELLAATDPFPLNPGEKRGLLVDAAVGKGTWTYVGLDLFREVPAGVPGGWRLLANLVSRPRSR